MSAHAFRFIHSADFHLENPLHGVLEFPDALRDLIVDAPMLAAGRVFDTAINEQVDLVILAGNVVNPDMVGPREFAFLREQFERLNENAIAVYWAGGSADSPDRWPSAAKLPGNVHVFASGAPEWWKHLRDGELLATIIGISDIDRVRFGAADFRTRDETFTIAVANGRMDHKSLVGTGVRYWALDGQHQTETISGAISTICYPGTPQGRCPREAGERGCLLVDVDDRAQFTTQLIATDVVRWQTEQIQLPPSASHDEVRQVLGERMLKLVDDSRDQPLLVSWEIKGPSTIGRQPGGNELGEELAKWLRSEFAEASQIVWTVSVELNPPAKMPASWSKEDTMLGMFLRAVEYCQTNESEPLELDEFLSDELSDSLGAAVQIQNGKTRRQILHEAALVGVELLGPRDAA